jgi:hypothetical protein
MKALDLSKVPFKMSLIKDLGTRNVIYSNGKSHSVRFGLFKCNCCESEFEATISNAKTNKTGWCYECSHDWSKNNKLYETHLGHGETRSRLYSIWASMITRCTNPNRASWKDYGGRGIKCDDFRDYLVFRDWALSNGYNEDLTLDRIDVNGDYTLSNCRWVDKFIQAQNTRPRNNKTGVTGVSFHSRINKFEPYIQHQKQRHYLGVFESIEEAASVRNAFIAQNQTNHIIAEVHNASR